MRKHVMQQKRKRWCRNLQRVCGSKQIWEALAFTGRFDVVMFRQTLQSPDEEEGAENSEMAAEESRRRRALHHAKAEAKAAFNEGKRLARRRELSGGASQPAGGSKKVVLLTRRQVEILEQWDSGMLLSNLNAAIVELGHGRLQSPSGEFLDIGGSTGGGSRRIIDGWVSADWRRFPRYPDEAAESDTETSE